ncbi:MAG: DNA methyltransferase, partial [Pseudomonadota bacterium]
APRTAQRFSLARGATAGELQLETRPIAVYRGELWTSRQRQAARIHEISYRACFKPQLPAYFIDRLSEPGDVVYDPFSGRGTTAIEAALRGRRVIDNDINPLSAILTRPRLEAPALDTIKARLAEIPLHANRGALPDLSMFYQCD